MGNRPTVECFRQGVFGKRRLDARLGRIHEEIDPSITTCGGLQEEWI
jgi:hypothetical protein